MHSSKDERKALTDFSERYARSSSPVVEEIERKVIGEVWGANGFTTAAQADLLANLLDLGPGTRLLDFGTGRGWPGLYLAKRTGCEVVLTDLPAEGLTVAAHRAKNEGVRLVGPIVASARNLPFGKYSFDAVVHTDVLC
ncbi:MAG: class I SAM-dependent methyltransferase [Actinomycetota bacterium]|nr:class I SAM-dependent methyltransferase [Actinomycetota bacterium]